MRSKRKPIRATISEWEHRTYVLMFLLMFVLLIIATVVCVAADGKIGLHTAFIWVFGGIGLALIEALDRG